MRGLLAASIVLAGSVAFACPQLNGTFNCGDDVVVTYATSTVGGVTVYDVTTADGSYQAMADGVERQQSGEVQNGNIALFKMKHACAATELVEDLYYSETNDKGVKVLEQMVNARYSLNAANDLSVTATVTQNGKTTGGTGVCKRQ